MNKHKKAPTKQTLNFMTIFLSQAVKAAFLNGFAYRLFY
jgi:hypothetical protein